MSIYCASYSGSSDYNATSETFTFNDTDLYEACLNVTLIDDQLAENNETFFVCGSSNYDQVILFTPTCATVEIIDDDGMNFAIAICNAIAN